MAIGTSNISLYNIAVEIGATLTNISLKNCSIAAGGSLATAPYGIGEFGGYSYYSDITVTSITTACSPFGQITITGISGADGTYLAGYSETDGLASTYATTDIGASSTYTFYNVPNNLYNNKYYVYLYDPTSGKSFKQPLSTSIQCPTYSISSATSVNEGSSIDFTVTTSGVANNTTLYWQNVGTSNGSDFVDNFNSGSVIINNNTGVITRAIKNDATTEGSETLILNLRITSHLGSLVATSTTVTINDTSKTPTYSLTSNATNSTVNEGDTLSIKLTTTNLSNGTTVPFTISGVVSQDINGALLSDSFTINNNSGSKSYQITNDQVTEGTETLNLSLTNGAASISIYINDTSQCPAYGTFLYSYCDGAVVGRQRRVYANGSCGTYEEYSDNVEACGYVRVTATYTVGIDYGANSAKIYNISMANGTGTGRQFKINSDGAWISYPTNTSVSGLSFGVTYDLIITDDSGLGNSYSFTTPSVSNISFTSATPSCVQYDGSGQIAIVISGGSGQYFYSKDAGSTWDASSSTSYTYSNLSNGTYGIKVKDDATDNIFTYGNVTVNCPAAPTAPILNSMESVCLSGASGVKYNYTLGSSTNISFKYSSDNSTWSTGLSQFTIAPGNYYFKIVDNTNSLESNTKNYTVTNIC
jgi:hypothetical protein